jgi:hypothetical protein
LRKKTDKLRVMLCVPGKHYTGKDKVIVAKIQDGKRTHFFKFGKDWSPKHINEMIPRLYMDFRFKRSKKKVS